jgi:hypothetical protein
MSSFTDLDGCPRCADVHLWRVYSFRRVRLGQVSAHDLDDAIEAALALWPEFSNIERSKPWGALSTERGLAAFDEFIAACGKGLVNTFPVGPQRGMKWPTFFATQQLF